MDSLDWVSHTPWMSLLFTVLLDFKAIPWMQNTSNSAKKPHLNPVFIIACCISSDLKVNRKVRKGIAEKTKN